MQYFIVSQPSFACKASDFNRNNNFFTTFCIKDQRCRKCIAIVTTSVYIMQVKKIQMKRG